MAVDRVCAGNPEDDIIDKPDSLEIYVQNPSDIAEVCK